MTTFLIWWAIVSYAVGLLIFIKEHSYWKQNREPGTMMVRLFLLLAAPLTSWHGALHYAQIAFCRLTKRRIKFWI